MTTFPPLKTVRYALEAAAVCLVYGFFSVFPLQTASNMGGGLMRRIGPLLGLSKKARRNLTRAFPEKSAEEIERIVEGMWDNLGRVAAEYPHLESLWTVTDIKGREHIEQMQNDELPGIMVGAHLANWEIPVETIMRAGLDRISFVYRRPNNPWVERVLSGARTRKDIGQIPKGTTGGRKLLAAIKGGGHLGILLDQKFNEGIAVPFFGREAMTAPAVASLALKFDCPLYPMRIERTGGAHFIITVYPALDVHGLGNEYEIMLKINSLIEGWIRERPEQWLWIHRRWPEEAGGLT